MFNRIRIIPLSATLLATFIALPAFAKVPFKAREANRETVTQVATNGATHSSMGRFGQVKQFRTANRGEVCTHSHRFSGQHRM